jgi:hypothetical protein
MSRTQSSAARLTRPEPDPFRLGWRYITRIAKDGSTTVDQVPLTEWDILHPQEGDFIVQNYAHTRDCIYIKESLETATADRDDVLVLCDHRVDWQEPGIIPHGPDVSAFGGIRQAWDPNRGTFPVHDMGASILLVVEVTSPSTRDADVGEKVEEYFLAKIPFYLLVDSTQNDQGQLVRVVTGYRAGSKGFVRMPLDPERGVWIPTVEMWFKAEGDRVRCLDRGVKPIPDRGELEARVRTIMLETAEAEVRAEEEKKRADREKRRADREKKRADAAEAKLRELKARLKKPKRKK